MTDVNGMQADRQTCSPSRLAWSKGRQPPGAESSFIKWTRWTLSSHTAIWTCDNTINTDTAITIIRPHHTTTHVDVAYCYRVSWSVGLSVCHTSEPCKNGWTDPDAIWVEDLGGWGNHVLDGVQILHGKRQFFWGGKGRPIVKHKDTLWQSVQKQPNQSRWHLGCELRRAQGIMC